MRAPVSTVTPGPKTTCGSTIASRPITVSAEKITLSGQVSVTPSSMAPAPAERLEPRLGPGQTGAAVHAHRLVLGQGTTPADCPAARATATTSVR
jgi:hypothetical protein